MKMKNTILNSPIPSGGFGRNLTSAECRALRDRGWKISERYIVVRQFSDVDRLGIVYYPTRNGGYSHAGIYVETKDRPVMHGGAREGAGRTAQTTDGGALQRKTVSVDVTTIRILTDLGDGEFSEGIRRAARAISS